MLSISVQERPIRRPKISEPVAIFYDDFISNCFGLLVSKPLLRFVKFAGGWQGDAKLLHDQFCALPVSIIGQSNPVGTGTFGFLFCERREFCELIHKKAVVLMG